MSSGEDKITAYFARCSKANATDFPIGIGDDMAQMNLGDNPNALISVDMLLDGSHFDTAIHLPEEIGYKSAAVSISDAAAMATIPFAMVVAVGIPEGWPSEKLKAIHKGIIDACKLFDCELIGGDITSWQASGKLAISTTIISKPGTTAPLRRDGAKAGDLICTTGTLGGSIDGKHLCFVPRVREAIWIAENLSPTSMMDITDGLSTDLPRILRSSDVGAVLEAKKIPISDDAQARQCPLNSAMNDGEDFELVFTIPQDKQDFIDKAGFPITIIGHITAGKDFLMKLPNGKTKIIRSQGYDHLRATTA